MARLSAIARLSPSSSEHASEPHVRPVVTLHNVVFLEATSRARSSLRATSTTCSSLKTGSVVQRLVPRVLAEVPYTKIEDVEIGGPGVVKTGGGFAGGGYGCRRRS